MINIKRNLTILSVAAIAWLFTDLDYDAKDQDSINRMIKWSPFSASQCIEAMQIAADNPRMSNLDSLNCPQIRDEALKKILKIRQAEIQIYSKLRNENPEKKNAIVYFANTSKVDASIYNENYVDGGQKEIKYSEFSSLLENSQKSKAEIETELSSIFRKMPWASKSPINPERAQFAPVKFELISESPLVERKEITQTKETNEGMMGDEIDNEPDAEPNTQDEHNNKKAGRPWQDSNGFMHYPDGTISSSPIESEGY